MHERVTPRCTHRTLIFGVSRDNSDGVAKWPRAMSAAGPSRHFAPPHDFGRYRGIAEVEGQPSIAKGDARDRGCVKTVLRVIWAQD